MAQALSTVPYSLPLPDALSQALQERILILDGGMGTMLQSYGLEEEDFRGERFADWPSDIKGNNDLLALTRPDIVEAIHRAYFEAGADIVETNTFNATQLSQSDYGMQALVHEINLESARLARKTADAVAAETGIPRFVAGVLGPTSRTCSISPDVNDPAKRNVTFDILRDNYREAALALFEGGADLILIETIFDTLNAKAAIYALEELFDEGHAPTGDDFRHHHRCLGTYAVRPDHRSLLELGASRAPAEHRPQLRAGRRGAAPLSA